MTTRRRTTRALALLAVASMLEFTGAAALAAPLAVAPQTHPAAAALQTHSSSSALPRAATPRFGDRGPHVMRTQQALGVAGITVTVDGIYGVQTAAGVRRFQTTRDLTVTGAVDAPTFDALGLDLPRPGDRGPDVTRLQKRLIARGIRPEGGADGIYGAGTEKAVRRFQARADLRRTGEPDAATAIALQYLPDPEPPTVPTTPPTTPPTTKPPRTTTTTAAPATTSTAPPTTVPTQPSQADLTVGAQGPAVVRLQQALVQLGLPLTGGVDGKFGNGTRAAVLLFQQKAGLRETGVVNGAARRRLDLVLPKAGDQGDAVRRLQTRLIANGIAVRGGADGIFGAATSAAVMTFQERRGLAVTGVVNDQMAVLLEFRPLPAELPGMPTTTAPPPPQVSLDVFPVQGVCWFTDTWLAPRGGGRLHQGVDIIAAEGKLIYAVADGTIERVYYDQPGSLSGNGVRLTRADGTYFFYAHFSRFAKGIAIGAKVKAGQVIGYNGETGNASGPHLHFEIHPNGGAAINPTPAVREVDACKVTQPLPQP